jgi:hypothetical protein
MKPELKEKISAGTMQTKPAGCPDTAPTLEKSGLPFRAATPGLRNRSASYYIQGHDLAAFAFQDDLERTAADFAVGDETL